MSIEAIKTRLIEGAKSFGVARWVIVGFLVAIWVVAAFGTELDLGKLLGDCLVRCGMNGVLVLALVLPVRAGNGLNFGIPLGIVCGLLAGILVMEFAAPKPFGIEALSANELARGWSGFFWAHLFAIPLGAAAGWAYGMILERVRGQAMMVGVYVGFGAVAGMCIVWLLLPVTSEELILPIGGEGVRQQILLDDHYKWILDDTAAIYTGDYLPVQLEENGEPKRFVRPVGFYFPTGLMIYWLGACVLMWLFLRTRLGTAMTVAGENPVYARSIGIPVAKMRVSSIVISTVLAAVGILVYSQSYGFYQLYKGPLWMAFMTVAALLLGGASLKRATVFHVIVGTLLFQSLLTTSLPVVNELVSESSYKEGLSNLPEIARLVIQNGVILYALSRVTGGRS